MLPESGVLHARGERRYADDRTADLCTRHVFPRQCHGAVVMRAVVSRAC